MEHKDLWPCIVPLPTDLGERIKYISNLFSSVAVVEILNMFSGDEEICQKEIVSSLPHSNKTVIKALKKLVDMGILHEEVKSVKVNNKRVRVKCYRLTEVGKWYNILFKDISELLENREALRQYLNKLALQFLVKHMSMRMGLGIGLEDIQNIFVEALSESVKTCRRSRYDAIFIATPHLFIDSRSSSKPNLFY